MDKIIPFPSRPRIAMGRPEPQLPKLSPRDLTLARAERQRTLREQRRPRRAAPGWAFFLAGILVARILDYIEIAIRSK